MRKSRFGEQIIGILREREVGQPTAEFSDVSATKRVDRASLQRLVGADALASERRATG